MSEIYKEWYGNYSASNLGNIRNSNKVLKKSVKRNGYEYVVINVDGKWKGKYVHRLVWEVFNGPIPEGYEINHIDEDKSNNALSNLELVTHKQNCNHGTKVERTNMTKRHNGTLGPSAKRVAQVGPDFKLIKVHESLTKACDWTGAKLPNISACCKNKNKTAKGFHWVIVPLDCQDVESFIHNHFE